MRAWIALVVIAACGKPPTTPGPSGSSGSAGSPRASATRPAPPTPQPPEDKRPIDFPTFPTELNARDPDNGMIYASADGGCHVYLKDDAPRPPGKFPDQTRSVVCPPLMLAPEWGWCLAPSTAHANAKGDECICAPGAGDPPGDPYRIPCPKTP